MPHSHWVNLQKKDQGQFLTLHHSSSRLNLERRADPAIFKRGNVRPGLIRDKGADLPNHFSLAYTEQDATPILWRKSEAPRDVRVQATEIQILA